MGMRRFWPIPSALLISGAYGLVLAFIGGTLASEPRKLKKPTPKGKGESLSPFPAVAPGGACRGSIPRNGFPTGDRGLPLLSSFHGISTLLRSGDRH
jgi:hypothetical protein